MDNSTSKKPLRREWSGHPTLNDIPRPIERVEAEVAAFQQAMSAGAALARICNPAMPLPVQPGSSSFDCPMARQVVSALRCLWDARTSRTDPQHSQSHYVPLRPLHPRPSHTPDDVPQITVHAAEQSARATSLKRQYKSLNGGHLTAAVAMAPLHIGSTACRGCIYSPTHRLMPCFHHVCYDHMLEGYDEESSVNSLCGLCHQASQNIPTHPSLVVTSH
ncbi:hypothetical protein M8818_003553 [Zalaria obscura]|uniref:Uncharacterized protein n=1 Tax=Zalaria obscura TaxID=2024903 RepID=A0ACC3SF11_9PEZI